MIETKKEVFKKISIYRINKKDTGSIPYQIIQLEAKVEKATEHLKNKKKDVSCQRALVKKNAQKRNFIKYLERRRPQQYQDWLK